MPTCEQREPIGGAGHEMHRRRALTTAICCALAAAFVACDGPQSALAPAGRGAERLADLFWWMTAGAAAIWLAVIALALYAAYGAHTAWRTKTADALVVAGGAVFPTVALAALLVHALAMLPALLEPAPPGALAIEVAGEQWWWRVRYLDGEGAAIDAANELHFPLGAPVELRLESPDVIHSLWIPALGGKVDMIPGRRTRLRLDPSRTGTFRGVCAEYCGTSHAWMAFTVVVEEREDFDRWLARQAEPATAPTEARAQRGLAVFLESGCGACHSVRGTGAEGTVGPDLTHVGSRGSIGAGLLANEPAAFRRWLEDPEALKPGVHMPAFGMLPREDLDALAHYLEGLE